MRIICDDMKKAAVSLEDVCVRYGDVSVLEDVNLTVYENEILGIIGPNGGGKTTILKVILGLIAPDSGHVSVFGGSISDSRHLIGYVPQHSSFDRQFPASVWDVVMMGRLSRGKFLRGFDDEDRRVCEGALATVDALSLRDKQIGNLSGGERQRVLVARALATDPKVLLLDEPTASADRKVESGFYDILGKLSKKMAVVLVSHDIGAVSVYVDKIACVNQRLFYHDDKEISARDVAETYRCPVELIAHGVPHRVLKKHKGALGK